MIGVTVFISCAADADHLRDIAADVMIRLTQMFNSQTDWALYIYQWDYRKDPGGPVHGAALAARSLEELDKSDGVVAIFSERIGRIATAEIDRAFAMYRADPSFEVWPYLDPATQG